MGLLRSVSKGIALTGAVVGGGALAVTARSVLATPQPLESALEGESHIFRSREGDIFYTVSGPAGTGTVERAEGERGGAGRRSAPVVEDAPPVLLLHSTHLSASSFEWRRNFSALSQEFRVYAPDLLGFGLSDRPATDYSANTYATFISDFAREVIGRPALVVARGQSAAFTTRAAYLDPHLFSRLVFISPTGIAEGAADGQEEHSSPIEALRSALRRVSKTTVGEVPYAFLTTKTALSLFVARQSYAHSEQITPDLVRHLFATTHQHGARFAPLAFMTGKLDLPVASDFARLQQPALLIWGEQDAINEPLHAEALRRLNPRARLELISSAGNAVQEEQSGEINELLRAWFLAPVELVDPSRQQPPEPPAARVPPASVPARIRPTTPLPGAAPTTPLPEEGQPTPPAQPVAEESDTPALRTEAAEAAASSSVEAPTDASLPAKTRLADESALQGIAAAMGGGIPAAINQADLTLPGEQQQPRADEAALLAPSAAPTQTTPPTDQVAEKAQEAQPTAAAYAEEQTVQAGDLMAELEAQAATEMLGQLPATDPGAAPLPDRAAPKASTAADAQQALPQAEAATPASQPTQPPTKATPRRSAPPKAATSRAPRTAGGQPPAHHEPHHPPQGGGKSPGARPSGGKKKK